MKLQVSRYFRCAYFQAVPHERLRTPRHRNRGRETVLSLAVILLAFVSPALRCGAQDMSTGSLNVTVTDSTGAIIPGAQLVLKDLDTNDIHTVTTKDNGAIVIPFLNPAVYSLTVSKEGFATSQYSKVTITTNQVTNLAVALKVGATTETVNVTSDRSPILDASSNTLSTTLDMKQVQDLPTVGRSVSALAFLVPGAVDDNFNNLPGGAENYSANGFSTMNARNKSGGFDANNTVTVQRLESTQEITVQTSELDASKGGTAAMDIGFLTKRGTNQFHGQLFEDYRSEAMNANSWSNNFNGLKRGLLIINDFGASVGGPLLKDRLFFFASLGDYRQPSQNSVSTTVPTSLALSGIYTYNPCKPPTSGSNCVADTSQIKTVNVLNAGASAGCPTCTNQINPIVANALANIQKAIASPGVTIRAANDPNHLIVNFQHHTSIVRRYPTLRLDYNVTRNFRLTGVGVGTFNYNNQTGNPPYPGQEYAYLASSSKSRNYQAVVGFDW
ncbi:MAG TPA: carboxypeptidase-like regulatory domain-containing protein, partial [Acidobacteriaceae bacterium]|nr:carboxypeptidase-like regulatory domain-containing protein [Acidobacteriaceae bacterium]